MMIHAQVIAEAVKSRAARYDLEGVDVIILPTEEDGLYSLRLTISNPLDKSDLLTSKGTGMITSEKAVNKCAEILINECLRKADICLQ